MSAPYVITAKRPAGNTSVLSGIPLPIHDAAERAFEDILRELAHFLPPGSEVTVTIPNGVDMNKYLCDSMPGYKFYE